MVKTTAPSLLLLLSFCMLVAVGGISSCKTGKAKINAVDNLTPAQRHVADSLKMAHGIDSADGLAIFKNKTNKWLSSLLNNRQSKWDDFRLVEFWKKDGLKESKFEPDSGFYNYYAGLLNWSPDSLYIFDDGSFGVTMGKDKNGNWYAASGDDDETIALINPKAKTREVLEVFGAGSSLDLGAHWVDSTQVAMLRYEDEVNTGKPNDTLLWIMNIKNNKFRKYVYRR